MLSSDLRVMIFTHRVASVQSVFLSLICFFSVLFSQAQSFQISPSQLYNSDYRDSVQVIAHLDNLSLSPAERQQLEEVVGSGAAGQFLQLDFTNADVVSAAIYLRFCRMAEEIVVFHQQENQWIPTLLNATTRGQVTILPSTHQYYYLSLGRGQTEALIVYVQFEEGTADPHYNELFLSYADRVESEYLEKTDLQGIYTGLVVLITLLSLVASFFLRYRPLLYFGLHMLFWIPYFRMQHNLLGIWDRLFPTMDLFQQSSFSVGFILLFSSLFATHFLRLQEHMGRWFALYVGSHVVVIGILFYSTFIGLLPWLNYGLAYILLFHLAINIWLSLRGIRPAQQLLGSMAVLIIAALAMSLMQIELIPSSRFTPYLFQIGTLIFSLILFFSLAGRVSKIRQDRREAEQLIKIKTQFFQDISHELRSPLSLVLDPLRKVYEELPQGAQKEALALAKNAGEGLQNLVDQILALSKHEFQPPPLQLRVQDINAFLRTQCSQYSSLAQSRQIRLTYSGPVGEIMLGFDADKLQQVIANLLSNALKFTPAGGYVELQLKSDADGVEINVTDNGTGISAKALPHIFNRFYQDPEAAPNAQPGTGIGLALCKALVEQHQGEISVQSTKGSGSTFTILLPNNSLAAEAIFDEQEEEAMVSETAKPLLLVAEDHPDLRNYLKLCLEEQYEVLLAKTGLEAWEMALERIPDVLLSDLMMPDLDGIELTQRIKTHKQTCHIPVLLLTAKSDQQSVNEGLAAGADDYIAKPFNSDELRLRVANILKQLEIWRQRVAGLELPKVAENTLNKVDRAFLEQLANTLTVHFANAEFGVEELSKEIGMSKTHLNRKLNHLVGHSANKLLQNYRLAEARKLLLQKDGNVSEIAFTCGFNSVAYFVKCFKDKYQETPGQLLQAQ